MCVNKCLFCSRYQHVNGKTKCCLSAEISIVLVCFSNQYLSLLKLISSKPKCIRFYKLEIFEILNMLSSVNLSRCAVTSYCTWVRAFWICIFCKLFLKFKIYFFRLVSCLNWGKVLQDIRGFLSLKLHLILKNIYSSNV